MHLRPITQANLRACLELRVDDSQLNFVASTTKSLAEAYVNPQLVPLAIYDVAARGYEQPEAAMLGFTMYELEAGIGFVMRLLIDRAYQGKGYGRAAMHEVIRRLNMYPSVELIATSYRRENVAAAQLYQSLGFVPWDIGYAADDPQKVYVRLPEEVVGVAQHAAT